MKDLVYYIFEKYNYVNGGDEFYTNLKDINKELSKYDFKNKIVYCNCDDPSFSQFYKYFKDNFAKLGIKQLISTYYSKEPKLTIYDGQDEIISKIKSGDFRDNSDIMDKCDIIVTNPPYSNNLPEELVKMCIKHNKDFIFVGPNHFITKRYALDLYKKGKLNVGYNAIYRFYGPDGGTKKAAALWYTTLDVNHPKVKLTQEYSDEDYPKYINYDAIHCPKTIDIPKDYTGNIATSVEFARKLNREQFEIIDAKSPRLSKTSKTFMKLIIKKKG